MEPFQRKLRAGWWIKVKDLTKPAGRQWVVRKGGETRKQAIIAQAAFEDRMRLVELGLVDRRQMAVKDKSLTPIADVIAAWKKHLTTQKIGGKYVKESVRCVEGIVKDLKISCLDGIETSDVEQWLDDRISSGCSNRTRNIYRDYMHAFCNFAKRRRMLSLNPIAEIQRLNEEVDRREMSRALSPEEFEQLLAAVPDKARRTFYLAAGRTGLRWSEVHRLTWQQVDFERQWIRLTALGTKSKRAEELPLSDRLLDALKEIKPTLIAGNNRIFPTKPTLLTLKRDLKRAGIAYDTEYGQVDRKSFRKMYCTHLQAAGVAFSTAVKLMRHSDPRLTSRIYTDARLLDLQGAVQALDEKYSSISPSDDNPCNLANTA